MTLSCHSYHHMIDGCECSLVLRSTWAIYEGCMERLSDRVSKPLSLLFRTVRVSNAIGFTKNHLRCRDTLKWHTGLVITDLIRLNLELSPLRCVQHAYDHFSD